MTARPRSRPEPMCPIRPGDPCTLCQSSVTGPQDCGLVYLVMGDPELREGVHRNRIEHAGGQ
ncbi:MAG TPA: DUF6767 domain-containing protein [Micromonosporaceae bacterium]